VCCVTHSGIIFQPSFGQASSLFLQRFLFQRRSRQIKNARLFPKHNHTTFFCDFKLDAPFYGEFSSYSNRNCYPPLSRRFEILAAHPQIAHRVHNIAMQASKTGSKPINRGTVVALSLILIIAASAVDYGVICLQTSFLQKK
jgi:hypothetical protein